MENTNRNILVFILLLFAVRLFHITEPPIEVSHNWRQTTSLMVARNFYQGDHNIMHPTLDENGEKPGIFGMEFPLLSYSIYLVSNAFGYDHWYGRLINLIVVSFGMWFFYRLLLLYFDKRISFFATIAYSCSALFHLARKVLPDPMSLSLIIIGIYYGTLFLREGKWKYLLPYFIFATAGALVKIPFGLYLAVLAFPFFSSQTKPIIKISFALASVALLAIVYFWYYVWNFHLSETYGVWYNSGRGLSQGLVELGENITRVLEKFYFSAFHGYLFFGLTLIGLGYAFYRKNKTVLYLILLLVPLYAVYMMKSGFLFAHHGYYALVIMPVMALLVGVFLVEIPKKWAAILLLVCVGESIANQQHDFFVKDKDREKIQLESIADQLGEKSDLVGLVCNQNPNEFYFLNRNGWLVMPEDVTEAKLLDLKSHGCKYLFMKRNTYNENIPFQRAFENNEYVVFAL